MSITEANYIELMKNCSKFNTRLIGERKMRYPVFDSQTGFAHRPSPYTLRRPEHRIPSYSPDYVCEYEAVPWRKHSSAAPADAVKMKMFLHNNPALSDAINNAQNPQPVLPLDPIGIGSSENSLDTPERRVVNLKTTFDEFEDEVDFAASDDGGSDEDDWNIKKRRKGGRSGQEGPAKTGKGAGKKASGANGNGTPSSQKERANDVPPEEKRHACNKCGARYKSRPGLSYHKAHVHGDGVLAAAGSSSVSASSPSKSSAALSASLSATVALPPPVIFSPSVEISNFCDLCLGSRYENKKTKQPEELVSCHDCGRSGHPSCLQFTENMIISTQKFGWQCIECKSCAICGTSDNDDKLLFCDDCDRGFHLYCLKPPLAEAPEDLWSCHLCQKAFGDTASAPSKT